MSQRSVTIDAIKGGLVGLMVVYHATYVAVMFGLADIDLFTGFWWLFPRMIAGGFVAVSGWNLAEKRGRGGSFGGFARRAGMLGLVALAISAVTWPALGKGFVFFGVIHLLALSSIIAWPLLGKPALAIAVGLGCLAGGYALGGQRFVFPWLAWLGLRPAGLHPADYLPLLPWFAFIAFGAAANDMKRRVAAGATHGTRKTARKPDPGVATRALAAIGKRSLVVYLVHLPLLYAIGWSLAAIRL
jgi:uncharacterized membrane protein